MVLIRSLIYLFFMGVSSVFYSLLMALLGRVLSFSSLSGLANSCGRANMRVLRLVCGLGYRVEGWENLPESNCIIMSNHQSTWETIALRGILPAEQSWILKKELLDVPFFGWALRTVEPIAIDRSAGRAAIKQVVEEGTEQLSRGHWVVVFPEGTRVAYGERKKHGAGASALAEKTGTPVLPIVHNAGRFWRRRGIKKLPGEITLVVGKPIETKGKSSSLIRKEVEEWMNAKLDELERDDATQA
jgi:1-acyl-sn-glycerol-3-phosphate acyltransferase